MAAVRSNESLSIIACALVIVSTMASASCKGIVREAPPRPEDSAEPDAPEVGKEFDCDGEHQPGPAPLRRLTVDEYAAAVEASVGVDIEDEARNRLPNDIRSDGFSNTASGLIVDVGHVEAFAALAQLAVERLDDVDAFLEGLEVTCRAFEASCRRSFIEAASLRVFRGPAREEDVASFEPVFEAVEAEGGDFEEATRFVLEGMLQSPRFLYRVERQDGSDPVRKLGDYEVASRLSFLLWGAPPDEQLMKAAAAGKLQTDAQIEVQARRMLEAPAARETSLHYVADWLHLSRLDHLARDEAQFPGWEDALAEDMKRETLALADWLMWEERGALTTLFDAQRSFLTERLAQYYGLEVQGSGFTEYDLTTVPERGGILTHGALLTAGGPSASMVHRGLHVLRNILCGRVEDPPPGVDTTPMETSPGFTKRDEAELRVESSTCGGCHSQMDTLAFGLERFDGTGAYALEDEHGNALRQDGFVVFPGTVEQVSYQSIAQLMDLLASSDRVRDCMSLKASQFSLGRPLAEVDACSLAAVRDRYAASDGSYQELMVAVALSPMMRTIGVDP